MVPGTRVTFAPDRSQQWVTEEPVGEVVMPTDEEVDSARDEDGSVGVLVQWDGGHGRGWYAPGDLIELP
jgi:hypothetical protein